MALMTVAGIPVGAPSTLTLPLNGRPTADLTLSQPVSWKAGDQVEVAIEGGAAHQMAVEFVGPSGGFTRARLVGGNRGLSREIPGRYYRSIEAVKVLREILEDSGEVVGQVQLPDTLAAWVRPQGAAHEALRALMMRYPTHVWQLTPAGRVDVGQPLWGDFEAPIPVESEDPASGTFTAGWTPDLRPGVRVTLTRGREEIAKRVTRVTHSVQQAGGQLHLRTTIGTGDGQDRGVSGLEAVARRALHWVDYLGLYDCEVIRDHGDHTLDLRPMHPSLPELTRVRLVQPLPGAKIKLKAGGVVLLSFQGGDPARPVALHCGMAELELLEVVTGRGQVLRVDDDRGQKSPDDARYQRPHMTLQDAAGQRVELWAESGQERVTVTDAAGQKVELSASKGEGQIKVNTRLTAEAGQEVTIKGGATVNIEAATINVKGGQVLLADGGPPVARVGDTITGTCPAGPVTGTITTGSGKVFAG